ncbi:hypothetical protein Kpol_1068p7 [Vanderwaltozyma polyspora DSM 70294]|uniref:Hcy-binding domain-containing protein n=1 Tax=Vanderwaltozyma polyspora (strain ATCC 22028 / DSM 70294 / BCRC 21397 / CBS 2163 / NBRC 10782 / NRRL Y-8283 / UCD 57-17) TaxID=436907 RepID=A7TSR2_VANPO|nr:uncharacterized protein Kpol_1068p7 [Vanderwaltozyma polyspora DSM 70294]EDO14697.1 hypothetical protein Kpol_1068p7 [Vanderwaltozyma polyspora DSM 70294]
MRVPIEELIRNQPDEVLVSDGGLGTLLESRGINVSSPLWSTVPFLKDDFWDSETKTSDRNIIEGIYRDYITSGSRILSTITYQTSFALISTHTEVKTIEGYKQLIRNITSFCRSAIGEDNYLIGSIGPFGARLGAEYTGNYGDSPSNINYLEYFKPQLEEFNNNDDIDIIGFETVPNKYELEAILSWDKSVISKPYYVSLSLLDNGGLRDGTSFEEIATIFKKYSNNDNLILTGANCISFKYASENISKLHQAIPTLPLIVYPNSGEIYDPLTKKWTIDQTFGLTWEDLIKELRTSNVRIVGGCCRTTPDDINKIKDMITKVK